MKACEYERTYKNKTFVQIQSEVQYISSIFSSVSDIKLNPNQPYILLHFNLDFKDENASQFLRNLRFITSTTHNQYKPSLVSRINPLSLLSIIAQCFLYHIENEINQNDFGPLQTFLAKLIHERLISTNHIVAIVRFCVVTSMSPRMSTVSIANVDWKNKRIVQLDVIHKVISLLTCIDVPEVTEDFCLFMNEHVLKNKSNYYVVIKHTKVLSLLYLRDSSSHDDGSSSGSGSVIVDALCKLYKFNYDKEILEVFLSKISSLFYNNNNAPLNKILLYQVVKRNILLLSEIMQAEEKQENSDSYMLNRGFVFENNNTGRNGIIVDKLAITEGKLTMFFSFNFAPVNMNAQYEYAILALENESKQKVEYFFYIKETSLYLAQSQETKYLCSITPGYNYVVAFSHDDASNKVTLHIKSQIDSCSFVFAVTKELTAVNMKLHVGKYNKKVFEGYIGPVILFKAVFADEFTAHALALKGSYEKMLYCKSYRTSQIDKYEPSKNSSADEIHYSNKEYIKALGYFSKTIDYSKLLGAVCPFYEGIDFSKEKLTYRNSDFLPVTTLMKFENVPTMSIGDCFCFEQKHLIFEFLKYEGFNFVIFNYEVLTANFNERKDEESFNTLMDSLRKLMEFTMEFFVTVNIEYYLSEMRMLLFSLKKCIFKVSKPV